MQSSSNFMIFLLSFGGAILLFFLGRSILLWYWCIDERMKIMGQQITESKAIRDLLEKQTAILTVMSDATIGAGKIVAITHKATKQVRFISLQEFYNTYGQLGGHYEWDIVQKTMQ